MCIRLIIICLALTTLSNCGAQSASGPTGKNDHYTFAEPTRDGTGKYYLGREIARVMGHLAAGWLERPERETEENVTTAINNMQLEPDAVVADIGAGSGYYTFRIAERVPEGKVFAVDIQPEMLAIIREKMQQQRVENIALIQGKETDPNLAENSVDMVFMVDVYHELSHPKEMMQKIVTALKPNGRFILLEYRMEDPEVPIKRLHKMSLAQAEKEMQEVGLKLQKNVTNLPWQHFMIFVRE